jgi:hypothetical protein
VAPHSWVLEVPAQEASDWWRRQKLHAFAAVVASCQARLALVANDVGLDGYAVPGFERRDGGVYGHDHSSGFVAENVRVLDNHGADAALEMRSACLFRISLFSKSLGTRSRLKW